MSNSTPPTVRARDRERKLRERHAKQVKAEQKERWWSRGKLIGTVVIFLIFTGIPALLSYFPLLSVLPASTVRSHDPMGTVFNLTNNGLLAVNDVDQSCGIDRLHLEGGRQDSGGFSIIPLGHSLGDLERGATKSLNCEHVISTTGSADASITIEITYKPLLWPLKITKFFPFAAEKADDGTWIWKSL